mmetsp:Transcript_712/g.2532  ORF Transcript_712/g.2532 Transcript_712/m.2532 type:complete len:501 (-) Transcript_712:164-1666(-)
MELEVAVECPDARVVGGETNGNVVASSRHEDNVAHGARECLSVDTEHLEVVSMQMHGMAVGVVVLDGNLDPIAVLDEEGVRVRLERKRLRRRQAIALVVDAPEAIVAGELGGERDGRLLGTRLERGEGAQLALLHRSHHASHHCSAADDIRDGCARGVVEAALEDDHKRRRHTGDRGLCVRSGGEPLHSVGHRHRGEHCVDVHEKVHALCDGHPELRRLVGLHQLAVDSSYGGGEGKVHAHVGHSAGVDHMQHNVLRQRILLQHEDGRLVGGAVREECLVDHVAARGRVNARARHWWLSVGLVEAHRQLQEGSPRRAVAQLAGLLRKPRPPLGANMLGEELLAGSWADVLEDDKDVLCRLQLSGKRVGGGHALDEDGGHKAIAGLESIVGVNEVGAVVARAVQAVLVVRSAVGEERHCAQVGHAVERAGGSEAVRMHNGLLVKVVLVEHVHSAALWDDEAHHSAAKEAPVRPLTIEGVAVVLEAVDDARAVVCDHCRCLQ